MGLENLRNGEQLAVRTGGRTLKNSVVALYIERLIFWSWFRNLAIWRYMPKMYVESKHTCMGNHLSICVYTRTQMGPLQDSVWRMSGPWVQPGVAKAISSKSTPGPPNGAPFCACCGF